MKLKAIVVSMFAVLASVGANAAEMSSNAQMHELLLNATRGAFAFGSGKSTTFGLNGGYNYTVAPGIQVGIAPELSWEKPTAGASTTTLGFLAGPTLNWPLEEKWDEAFFVFVGAGVQSTSGATGTTDFQFGGELGKRFRLMEGFTYRPSFAIRKVGSASANFAVNVLSFSAVF